MNNNEEPRGAEDGEEHGEPGGISSDSGWRQVLSGLGVDVEHDRGWQSNQPGPPSPAGPARKPRRPEPQDGATSEATEDGAANEAGPEPTEKGGNEMEERGHWVSESEVSIGQLHELFDGAYMECEMDEDGDLRVVTDSGPRIFLSLHEPNKLIRYMAFYKFREESAEYDKLLFVNALNDDIVFIRFSLNGTDTLIADYYLPYARGASPFHIINAAKLMGRVITSGIRQHDTNNLLE